MFNLHFYAASRTTFKCNMEAGSCVACSTVIHVFKTMPLVGGLYLYQHICMQSTTQHYMLMPFYHRSLANVTYLNVCRKIANPALIIFHTIHSHDTIITFMQETSYTHLLFVKYTQYFLLAIISTKNANYTKHILYCHFTFI